MHTWFDDQLDQKILYGIYCTVLIKKKSQFDIDLTMMYFITKEYVHITCPAKNNYVISCSIIMK